MKAIQKDPHASYRLLEQEFEARGYSVRVDANEERRVRAIYTRPSGEQWRTDAAKIIYPSTTYKLKHLSKHKPRAYEYAQKCKVRVPDTVVYTTEHDYTSAKNLLDAHPRLVVKPSNASLSYGLTTDISTESALRDAITRARTFSSDVIVQEQVGGEEVRFVVMKGKVVAALLRQSPQVIGDGRCTVDELIEQENNARKNITTSMVAYPQLTRDMLDAIDFQRIPKTGEIVKLSKATMVGNGASVFSVLDEVDPSYVAIVKKLVDGLDTELLVVDMMIDDHTQPASRDNYAFIEFNTAPVLKLFYSCRDGKNIDILSNLVDAIDETIATPDRQTVGSFEPVILPELDDKIVLAKVDTGAYSGAVHCTNIKVVKRDKQKYIQFCPYGEEDHTVELRLIDSTKVTSSTGHSVDRYLVETTILIEGRAYPITIGLADRGDMKFSVLLGRRFLREQNIVVDTRINQHLDSDGERA